MSEVLRGEDRFAVPNPCERCGEPMHEDRIGVCPRCHEEEAGDPGEDFWAWGGWRRAFGVEP